MTEIMFVIVGISDNMYRKDFEENIYNYEN